MKQMYFQAGSLNVQMDFDDTRIFDLFHSKNVHVTIPGFRKVERGDPDLKIRQINSRLSYHNFDGERLEFSVGSNPDSIYDALFFCVGAIDRMNQEVNRSVLVHSSSIVIDGKSYIFQGGSNSGKTLVAYALKKRGFQVVSLDHTIVEDRNPEILVTGGTRAWRVKPAAMIKHFPEIKERFPQLNYDSFSPKIIDIEDWHNQTEFLLGGIYIVTIVESELSVRGIETLDYQIMTYPDISKYVRGLYPLNSEIPAPNLDSDELASWRLDLTKRMAKSVKVIRGDIQSTLEYIIQEAKK